VTWPSNPHRPFCSLACRLLDLGRWLDERYRVPGEALPDLSGGDAGDRTGRAAPDAGA